MCSRDIESVIKLLEESSTDSGLLYTPLVQAYGKLLLHVHTHVSIISSVVVCS